MPTYFEGHQMSTPNALPIAVYHKATLQGVLVSDESCVAENDVFTGGNEDDFIGEPLVRLSDALAAIAAASAAPPLQDAHGAGYCGTCGR